MSVALRGNLEDFGLSDVFQLIGQQRKTGVLEVSNAAARVQLRFDAGRVVSAAPVGEQPDAAVGEMLVRRGVLAPSALESVLSECAATLERVSARLVERGLVSQDELDATEGFLTSETIFELLRQNEGSFHFSAQPVPHERDPADLLGAEEILMEGLRMVDEWRTLARVLPPEDAVLKRKRGFDAYLSSGTSEARKRSVTAERVYLLIDGRLTFRRVIDLSQLGTFEASRIVADLMGAGVVEALARREPRARAIRADEQRPRGAVLASAVVLGMLGILALFLHLQAPAAAARTDAMVATTALDSAREAFETRRLRNALDAWHAARGDWPDRLARLPEAGWIAGDALTSVTGAPYYYERSADGFVLLSPER